MKVNITFRNMDTSDAIKEYVSDKLGKLKKLAAEPVEANVILSVQRHTHACEVLLTSDGRTFQGSEGSEDIYSSVDMVLDKIQRQMRDSKARRDQRQ